jgi:hypothetical protein
MSDVIDRVLDLPTREELLPFDPQNNGAPDLETQRD